MIQKKKLILLHNIQRWIGILLLTILTGIFAQTSLAHNFAQSALGTITLNHERITQQTSDGILHYPSYLINPESKELGPGSSVVFWRTTDDTCGLYTWGEFTVASNQGAPPHLHYSDDEWFLPTQTGPIKMFSAQDKQPIFVSGQLPGFNEPSVPVGDEFINKGDLLFSPKGHIHYFTNENEYPVTGFLNIWAPGFGIRNMFDAFKRADFNFSSDEMGGGMSGSRAQALLDATGLWGVPHDVSGQEVGKTNFTKSSGRVYSHPANIEYLQRLIDQGEACYPSDGRRPES